VNGYETKSPIKTLVYWALAITLVGVVLYVLGDALTSVFVAFILAYFLNPVVERFESWRIPRVVGIVLLLVVVLLVLVGFALLVLPSIVQDVVALASELPKALHRFIDVVLTWLGSYGIKIPKSTTEMLEQIKGRLPEWAEDALMPAGSLINAMLGSTLSALGTIVAIILVPVFTFYLLLDFNRIVDSIGELIPINRRSKIIEIFRDVDRVLGQFVRGQLIVMAILACLYAVSYSIIGVRLALPIGIVGGLLSFIPYVGGATALTLGLIMAGLHFTGWIQLISVVAAYGLIQILDGLFITPRIVGEKLGLSPVWVLIALMIGGELFGFIGVMLALPASAVIKVLVVRGLASYKNGSFYRGADSSKEDSRIDLPVSDTSSHSHEVD
jgi:predicted PurR-regulated permease PerM